MSNTQRIITALVFATPIIVFVVTGMLINSCMAETGLTSGDCQSVMGIDRFLEFVR